MRAIINAHSQIAIGPETGVFCGRINCRVIAESLEIPESAVRKVYRQSACLGQFAQRIMEMYLGAVNKPRWGEKSPCNIRGLEFIFRFFPQAKVIHMLRDGRDVVCSLRTHPKYRWNNGVRELTGIVNDWEKCVGRWVRDVSAGLAWRSDARYREVRYEDLIESPREILESLLSWLGEPWEPAVMSFHDSHVERSSDVTNPGIKKPVYRDSIGRWVSDLPAEARRCFTDRAHQLLAELGYAEDPRWVHQTGNDMASSSSMRLQGDTV
jgi:hypothetical protein